MMMEMMVVDEDEKETRLMPLMVVPTRCMTCKHNTNPGVDDGGGEYYSV